jgi:hypothetical protein
MKLQTIDDEMNTTTTATASHHFNEIELINNDFPSFFLI